MASTTLTFVAQPGDDGLIDKFQSGQPLSPDEQYHLLQIAQAEIADDDRAHVEDGHE